jgi:hypothetical protein
MTGGAWGCPHELDGRCGKVRDRPCDPGMKGCELYGRYVFFNAGKNGLRDRERADAGSAEEKTGTLLG